jgi:type VI secretion system protein ImpE
MNASELFKAGKLQDALEAQIKEVKANPADHAKRLFLFELLAFRGDLDRARRQIEAINYGDLELDTAVLAYRKLLDAEQARRRLFSDGLTPRFLTDAPDHVRVRLEAVNRLREKRPGEARELLEQVNAARPPLQGQLNDKPFTQLRDCDDLFAGVLEVMAHGNYYWVPLEQVASVTMNAPRFPRDLLWVPARLEMRDAAGDVFLPALYPGSHEHPDDQIKLGRATDWRGAEGEPVLGAGVRVFLVDDDSISPLEWRNLQVSQGGSEGEMNP